MFFTLTNSVICVLLLVVPGLVSRRMGWISDSTAKEMSSLQVRFIYPCLIFSSIFTNYGLKDLIDCVMLPVTAFLIMTIGYIVGLASCRVLSFNSTGERRVFIFQCALNNFCFLPLPIVEMMYGGKGVAALLLSSLGAEAAIWSYGVMTLTGARLHLSNLRHMLNPPMLALYAAVAARVLCDHAGWTEAILNRASGTMPSRLLDTLRIVGAATIPIAMTVGGCRLAMIHPRGFNNINVWAASAFRLLIIPVLAILLIRLLPLRQVEAQVMIIVATMPVAISSFVMTEVYGGDKEFVATTVAVTHVLALATVPAILTFFL